MTAGATLDERPTKEDTPPLSIAIRSYPSARPSARVRRSARFGGITALSLLAWTSGCAAIVSESSYPVLVDSLPREASFVVRDEDGVEVHAGTTPETIVLAGSAGAFDAADYTVTFRLAGHAEHTAQLEAELDLWYLGNLLFPGLLGFLFDPMLGSMWELEPHVTATLQPASE